MNKRQVFLSKDYANLEATKLGLKFNYSEIYQQYEVRDLSIFQWDFMKMITE